MSKELSLLDDQSQLPAYLQGIDSGVSSELMAAVGGQSLNRIGTKGNRFRQVVGGEEVGVFDENYLDVIIVGAAPAVSRRYYSAAYSNGGDNAPPTCYSVDGIRPAEDVHQKQSDLCATCVQNIKGSKVSDSGAKVKACSYFRRLVIRLAGDTENLLYRLDVTAMGLFGESQSKLQKYALNDYAKALKNRGLDAGKVVTRLSFDTDQSVPKLLFQPARFISEEDALAISVLEPAERDAYLEISMKTVDLSEEESNKGAPDPGASTKAATQKPKATPKPKAKPVQEELPIEELSDEDKEEAMLLAKMAALKAKKDALRADGEQRVQAAAKPAAQKASAPAGQKAHKETAPVVTKAAAEVTEVCTDEEMANLLSELDL